MPEGRWAPPDCRQDNLPIRTADGRGVFERIAPLHDCGQNDVGVGTKRLGGVRQQGAILADGSEDDAAVRPDRIVQATEHLRPLSHCGLGNLAVLEHVGHGPDMGLPTLTDGRDDHLPICFQVKGCMLQRMPILAHGRQHEVAAAQQLWGRVQEGLPILVHCGGEDLGVAADLGRSDFQALPVLLHSQQPPCLHGITPDQRELLAARPATLNIVGNVGACWEDPQHVVESSLGKLLNTTQDALLTAWNARGGLDGYLEVLQIHVVFQRDLVGGSAEASHRQCGPVVGEAASLPAHGGPSLQDIHQLVGRHC
mmetsp:Transcript_38214/g.95868  ORF Transcript_38214/g.95868 Transcript_38214/m.95868 type:complete len:311 (+) Transcript_38214:851-1783(+)